MNERRAEYQKILDEKFGADDIGKKEARAWLKVAERADVRRIEAGEES